MTRCLLPLLAVACHHATPVPAASAAPEPPPDVSVAEGRVILPVPVRTLDAGTAIGSDDLMIVQLPAEAVPSTDWVLRGLDSVLGRVVAEPLFPFELIRVERLQTEPAARPMPPDADLRLSRSFTDPTPPSSTVMAIVAGTDLPVGHVIRAEDLYAVEIPPDYLYEGVFLHPDHVVGRSVCLRTLPHEFLRAQRLCD